MGFEILQAFEEITNSPDNVSIFGLNAESCLANYEQFSDLV